MANDHDDILLFRLLREYRHGGREEIKFEEDNTQPGTFWITAKRNDDVACVRVSIETIKEIFTALQPYCQD